MSTRFERLLPDRAAPVLFEGSGDRWALERAIDDHRVAIDRALREHGAILFRGFDIDGATGLDRIARMLSRGGALRDYVEGNSPRTTISDRVYTSTEYPAELEISLHNELSYSNDYPLRIFFFCETPAKAGGETPIADGREVLARLDPKLVERFTKKRVKYIRVLHSGRGFGRSWQATFGTSDRTEVERYLSAKRIDFEWTANGRLRTSHVAEAVVRHPVTGELVWFNQAEQWHPSALDPRMRAAIAEENLPHQCRHGDDSPLDEADLIAIRRALRESEICFPWKKNDLLVLDNVLMAHGRRPFEPPRRVLVAMSDAAR